MVLRILLLALALPPLEGSRESPAQEPEAAALLQLQGDGVQFTDEFTSCPPVPKITCHKQHGVQMSGPTFAMKQMFKSMPDQGLSPVKCPVCNARGPGHLYSVERYDGLGQRAAHLLLTIATARHLNLNFGGLLPSPDSGVHGADVSTCLGALIGSNYGAVIRKVRHPQFDACVFGKEALLSKPSLTDSRDVFFHECMFKNQPHQFLTPAFLAELRKKSHVLKHPTPFFRKKRRFHVAVHVRRGDIMEQRTRSKPDQDYLSAVQAVLDLLPPGTSDVHVFSTTSEGKFSTKSFDAYRSRGMYVHLNGDEMTDWAHMAQADVLVQAPSSFSWVAGVLNPNCVVGFSTFPDRLPQWIVHNNGKFKGRDRERLRKCLSKLRSH